MSNDPVNNPKHYDLFPNEQSFELIEKCLTSEEFKGFLKGNILKYRLRAGKKGDLQQDIDKANWYQDKLWAMQKEWPKSEGRIENIIHNGNCGEHYKVLKREYIDPITGQTRKMDKPK